MKRAWIFRGIAVLVLLIISGVMMVIGRGHTVYVDNKPLEYNGQEYSSPYKIAVYVDGEQIGKYYKGERGMSTCIGQQFAVYLEVTEEKGDEAVAETYYFSLPYNMDGVVVNLPGLRAGLPPEAYISEFVSNVAEESAEDVVIDEFAMDSEF